MNKLNCVLTIRPERKQLMAIPHYLLINGQLLGVMKDEKVSLKLPAGRYRVTVKSMYKFIESSLEVTLGEGDAVELTYGHSERLWNILFDIDLILWFIKRFVTIPQPWDTIYEVVSNGFFIIWLLRTWLIRKRYFRMKTQKMTDASGLL